MALSWMTAEIAQQVKAWHDDGCSSVEITRRIQSQFGQTVTSRTIRRYFHGDRQIFPGTATTASVTTVTKVSPEKTFEADKKLLTLKAERDYYKTLYHDVAKQSAAVDKLIEVARTTTQAIPQVQVLYKAPKVSATSPQSVVAPLSDTHIGEFVDPKQMVGLNSYNMEVFNNRLFGWANQVVSLVALRRTYAPIPRLYVPLLGDLVSGDIHLELVKSNLDSVMGQMIRGAHLIAQSLTFLAQHFEEVNVSAVVGNHGRMVQKPPAKDITVSWDYLTAQWIAAFCRNQKNIHFEIPQSFMHTFEVVGQKVLILHGDSMKSWQGIPYYGINRAVAQLRQALQIKDEAFDSVMMGHFHRHEELDISTGNVFIQGCFKGGDEFSFAKLHSVSRPSHFISYWHPKHGYISKDIVYLDKYDTTPSRFVDALPDVWAETTTI